MWVEADCNLSSGESLVRQVLVGKNFFKDEFGIETDVLWLPDVFGYSAALPQILQKAGVDYFSTIKINWSQFNKLPVQHVLLEGHRRHQGARALPADGRLQRLSRSRQAAAAGRATSPEKDRCELVAA